jgi:hypothetical protein
VSVYTKTERRVKGRFVAYEKELSAENVDILRLTVT